MAETVRLASTLYREAVYGENYMRYIALLFISFSFNLLVFSDIAFSKPTRKISNASTHVSCPKDLNEPDCDAFVAGYEDAQEDHKIMSQVEKGNWKDDKGDLPAYQSGYQKGWQSR